MTHVFIVKPIPEGSSVLQRQQIEDKFYEQVRQASAYFDHYLPEYKVRITGVCADGFEQDKYDRWNSKFIRSIAAANGVTDIDKFGIIQGQPTSKCGQAIRGGAMFFVHLDSATTKCGARTIVHEIIHTLNRDHCGVLKHPSWTESVYSSGDDIMGWSAGWKGLSVPTVWGLHMYTDKEVLSVKAKTQVVNLVPLELRLRDMREEEYRFVLFGDDKWSLSIRKGKGVPFPEAHEEAVYIHRLWALEGDEDHQRISKAVSRLVKPVLMPRDVIVLPDGQRISYVVYDYDNEVATVRIEQ